MTQDNIIATPVLPYMAMARRGGLPESVRNTPRENLAPATITAIAKASASGGAPWQMRVLDHHMLQCIGSLICEASDEADRAERASRPDKFRDHFEGGSTERDLYSLLGVEPELEPVNPGPTASELRFFRAAGAVLFTIDRSLEGGAWSNLDVLLTNVHLLSGAKGLQSHVRTTFEPYHALIRSVVGLDEHEALICGVGFELPDRPVRHTPFGALKG